MDKATQYLSVLTALIAILGTLNYIIARFVKIELKVETMWDFLFKKAISETVSKGLGEINSPMKVTDEIRLYFSPLEQEFKQYYRENKTKFADDRAMFPEFQKVFGDKILEQISIPNKIGFGDSVIIAMTIAKED